MIQNIELTYDTGGFRASIAFGLGNKCFQNATLARKPPIIFACEDDCDETMLALHSV
jgi:hypothetical protein